MNYVFYKSDFKEKILEIRIRRNKLRTININTLSELLQYISNDKLYVLKKKLLKNLYIVTMNKELFVKWLMGYDKRLKIDPKVKSYMVKNIVDSFLKTYYNIPCLYMEFNKRARKKQYFFYKRYSRMPSQYWAKKIFTVTHFLDKYPFVIDKKT